MGMGWMVQGAQGVASFEAHEATLDHVAVHVCLNNSCMHTHAPMLPASFPSSPSQLYMNFLLQPGYSSLKTPAAPKKVSQGSEDNKDVEDPNQFD